MVLDPQDGSAHADSRDGTPASLDEVQQRHVIADRGPVTSGSRDRRLAVIGAACVALSIVSVLIRMLGELPSSAATIIVLIAATVGLRVAMVFFAKSASSPSRARVKTVVSSAGLAVSAVVLVSSLPVATRLGGAGNFVSDLFAHLWTLALLTVMASPVRTFGWRAFVGAGMSGFLALTALARLVGTPVVTALGSRSMFATSIWAPVTEELIKALPLLLLVFFAVRRRTARPSAIDVMLMGAWIGTGFALYENTQFGRGGVHWSAAAPFSLIVPSEVSGAGGMLAAGHTVWTALIGLGLGFAFLYRDRYRRAWIALPVTVGVAVVEHCLSNALLLVSGNPPLLESFFKVLTLGGWLSSILLISGAAAALRIEWRELRPTFQPAEWVLLRPELSARRAQQLAVGQTMSRSSAPTAVSSTGSAP